MRRDRIAAMLRILKITCLTLCLALTAVAADVDGAWKAVYQSPDGNQRESTFHFKADGGKLTGKVVSAMGETEIKEGTISGEDIAFSVVRNFNGNEFTLKYKGKVAKDEIKLNVSFGDRDFDIVAKRQTS
jgi:hypothetical protein